MIPTFSVGGLGNTRMVTAAAAYSDEALQFFARLSVVPTTPRKDLYAACIDALVTAGVWAKLDALYLCVSEDNGDTDTALTNLKQAAFKATVAGTPGFTAAGGFVYDSGSSSFLSTGFNPTTAAGHYSLNSASFFAWPQGTGSDAVDDLMAVFTTTTFDPFAHINNRYSDDTMYAGINSAVDLSAPSLDGSGLWLVTRLDGTTASVYRNGAEVISGALAATGLPNEADYGFYMDYRVPGGFLCAGIASGLSAGEQLALYNAVHTFLQTAAGVP